MGRLAIVLLGLFLLGQFSGSGHASEKRGILIAQRAERGGTGTAAWQLVKQPMELPDLPQYSGKATFTHGLMYPNKPGGPAINLMFKVKDHPDAVMQWYRDTLKANSWKVIPDKNQNAVRATKGKNGVVVNVGASKAPGYFTELKISYKLAR
ncbi:MAG TPA: hypothetical protein PKD05_14435 [Candidatus Melainabacteria bacterium]|nr:hypothetical protein [Candidatus Melainabacteria bacterium]HMP52748.1 hypothetical protein [Candidatus Melainabacteria bacterium]